jgi:hypothetical protein
MPFSPSTVSERDEIESLRVLLERGDQGHKS